jgi:hypothetical protein
LKREEERGEKGKPEIGVKRLRLRMKSEELRLKREEG